MKSKITFSALLICFSMLFIFFSCKKENSTSTDSTTPPATGSAIISGRVYSANGNIAIGNAKVEADGKHTFSDKSGDFSLTVSPGSHEVTITTGSGVLFKTTFTVNVVEGVNQTLNNSDCKLQQLGNLAYIPGAYDAIEHILIDSLGYTATAIGTYDLLNTTLLSGYDAIFINCDHEQPLDSAIYANLDAFVNNGGSLYVSDFGVEYLTGDGNFLINSSQKYHQNGTSHESGYTTLANCTLGKIGGFIADSSLCTSKSGLSGPIQAVHINDAGLVFALGKDSVDITYDLGGWEVVDLYDVPFEVVMEKTNGYPNGPVALATPISESGIPGRIIFSTFHNEPQGILSGDVQTILQYFILTL